VAASCRLAAVGQKRGAGPQRRKQVFLFIFQFFFKIFKNAAALNQFLSKKMAFSGNGPKMKVS
jgi:hypothetical protein